MSDDGRLSQIETLWSIVYHAHADDQPRQSEAQQALLTRYGPAIRSYLLAALKDPSAADDAFQEFAVQFLRGKFANVHEHKGRFRNFLKVILSRIVADHFRQGIRKPAQQLDPNLELADDAEARAREEEFTVVWRDELLARAWRDLAAEEARVGKPWMRVLRLRVENPEWKSVQLAEALGEQIGEEVSAARLRVTLHRARERFSKLLIKAVTETLPDSEVETIEQELAELKLLQYCQVAIAQRKQLEQGKRTDAGQGT
jgi:RNA polymerase sigma-70 factor (ECF subfamily)